MLTGCLGSVETLAMTSGSYYSHLFMLLFTVPPDKLEGDMVKKNIWKLRRGTVPMAWTIPNT